MIDRYWNKTDTDFKTGLTKLETDFSTMNHSPSEGLYAIGTQLKSGSENIIDDIPGVETVKRGSSIIYEDVKQLPDGGLYNLSKQIDSGLTNIFNNGNKDTNSNNTVVPSISTTTIPAATVPGTTVPETTVPGTTVPGTTVPGTTVPGTTVPGTTVPGTTKIVLPHQESNIYSSVTPVTNKPIVPSYVTTRPCKTCNNTSHSRNITLTNNKNFIMQHEGILIISIIIVLILLLILHIY